MSTERKTKWGETVGRIPVDVQAGDAPLTPMQQRVWFVEASSPGRPDFNICTVHRLRGALNEPALTWAFAQLVRQQAALRLCFNENASGDVRQWVADLGPQLVVETCHDLSESALMAHLTAIRLEPFPLRDAPLCRARLIHLGPDEAVFIFVGHHLICDGWSMMLVSQAMANLYEQACARPDDMVAGLAPSVVRQPGYLDFARWQTTWLEGDEAQADVNHWLARLTPLPDPLVLSVEPRQAVQATNEADSRRIQVPVSASMLAEVRALARTLNVSLFAVMLSAFFVTLGRAAGRRDVVVGMPAKGRHDAEMADVIGFFANTLPIRLTWDADDDFATVVARCDAVLKDALTHAEVPFERLLRRLPIQRHDQTPPVYQALFSYLDLRRRSDAWGNLARSSISVSTFGGAEDLSLLLIERQEDSVLEWCFRAGAVPELLIGRLSRRFQCVINAVTAPEGAASRVGAMALMDEAELASLCAWSSGDVLPVPAPTVFAMVMTQAHERPSSLALLGEVDLSYARMMADVERAAAGLRALGVAMGSRVALCLPQGPLVTQAVLAVWACRAAYVPLDPTHPPARTDAILVDAGCTVLVVDGLTPQAVGQHGPDTRVVAWSDLLEQGRPLVPGESVRGESTDVAYVMYTSGSTGQPKGVVVTQGAVVNLLASLRQTLAVQADDRWLAVTTPSFDISVLESFLPLTSGAAVMWASSLQVRDGFELAALIEARRISCLQATPAAWRLLLASAWPGVKVAGQGRFLALVGGEALPADLADQMLARGLDVWNMYGPTETTVWSTCARVTPASLAAGVSIGRPIANTTVLVLDEAGALCPPGAVGHLHIAGAGLAQGYWRRDDLSARQFVTVHDTVGQPVNAFATGDLAYWDLHGTLHCLGRIDRQIKWRGFRIEPDEIESCLMRTGQCREVVVTLLATDAGPTLVAFQAGPHVPAETLRAALVQALPAYMVPQHFVHLPLGIPRLPNGKVDHRALLSPSLMPALDVAKPVEKTGLGTLSTAGQVLREIWRTLLQVSDIEPTDNFFDLGGHSLLALKACVQMEQRLGLRLGPQRYVFETFAQLLAGYEALQPQAMPASMAQRIQQRIKGVFGRP